MSDKYAKEIAKELKSIRRELEKMNKQNNYTIMLNDHEIVDVMKPEGSE